MKKWISLLLAMILLMIPGMNVLSEEEADDDTVPVPIEDVPEEGAQESEAAAGSVQGLRTLDAGDEGDDVLFLQMRLKSLSYFSGEENGKYGNDTKEAVLAFQKDNQESGLAATGIADAETQVLLASSKYRKLVYGSEGEDVSELQTRLSALGYYKGKISGKYLEGSQNGIKQFQKNSGLDVTGEADPLTQEALFSYDAIGAHDIADEPEPTPSFDISSFYLVDENDSGVPMPAEPVPFTKELKKNSQGDAVRQLQERMKQLGYYDIEPSGQYKEKTIAAVKKIQEQNGMDITGRTDETTWNLIFNDPRIVLPDQTPKPSPTPVPVPFAITVDVKNQIVSVYARDEEGNYTVPVRQMLCSSGKKGTPSPVGDWVLNGRKANWCYFPKWGDYARYWTRINSKVAFHSPIYSETSLKAMKEASYKALGNRASHGCIRLSVPDAKWIYDNVGAGTVVSIREDLPKDEELKEALLAEKPKTSKSEAPVFTPEPEYIRTEVPQIKGALKNGTRSEEVFWVQNRLKELGYYTTKCTGHFKNRTEQAVMDFQRDHGFWQNGIVDQNLINAMAEAEKITPTPEITPEPTPGPIPTRAP